jgi:hypothetical protein
MKRKLLVLTTSIALLSTSLASPSLATVISPITNEATEGTHQNSLISENVPENSVTIGQIESLLFEYFAENDLDYKLGSPEIVEYFTAVLLEDADEKLAQHPNYKLIRHYAAEYLHELEKLQIELYSSDSSNGQVEEVILDEFNLDNISDKTVGEIKEEVTEEEILIEQENKEFKEENGTNTFSIAATYSGTSAASYAQKWAKSRNSLYNSHLKDCTNFVSQAVYAGGKSERKPSSISTGITSTTSYWYSDRYQEWRTNYYVYRWKESSSWIGVADFYSYWSKYLSTTTSTSKSTIRSNAIVGDVIQFKNSEGRWYHSMIVTKKTSTDIYLSGHTNDSLDKPFSNISGNSSYRVIKFR